MAPSTKVPKKAPADGNVKKSGKKTTATTLTETRARVLRMPGSRYPARLVDAMTQEDLDNALAIQRRYDSDVAAAIFDSAKKLSSPQRSDTTTSSEVSLLAPVFDVTNDLAPDVKRIFARTRKLRDDHELSKEATEELMKETHEVLHGEGSYATFLAKRAWYASHPECLPPTASHLAPVPEPDSKPAARKRPVQSSWEESTQDSTHSAQTVPTSTWSGDDDAYMQYDSDPSSGMSPDRRKISTPTRRPVVCPAQDIWFNPTPHVPSLVTGACVSTPSPPVPVAVPVFRSASPIDLVDTDDSSIEDVTPLSYRFRHAPPVSFTAASPAIAESSVSDATVVSARVDLDDLLSAAINDQPNRAQLLPTASPPATRREGYRITVHCSGNGTKKLSALRQLSDLLEAGGSADPTFSILCWDSRLNHPPIVCKKTISLAQSAIRVYLDTRQRNIAQLSGELRVFSSIVPLDMITALAAWGKLQDYVIFWSPCQANEKDNIGMLIRSTNAMNISDLEKAIRRHPLYVETGGFVFGLNMSNFTGAKNESARCLMVVVERCSKDIGVRFFTQVYNDPSVVKPLHTNLFFYRIQNETGDREDRNALVRKQKFFVDNERKVTINGFRNCNCPLRLATGGTTVTGRELILKMRVAPGCAGFLFHGVDTVKRNGSPTYLRFPLQNRDLVYTRLSDLEFGLTRLLHPDDYPLFIENGGLSYEDGTLLCPPIGTVADVPMTDIDDDDDVEILKLVRRRPVPPIPAPASAAVFIAPAPAAVTFDPLLQETWARVATDRGGKKPSKYSRSDPIPSSILPSSGQPFGVFTPSTRE
jgi:hypothetical protein